MSQPHAAKPDCCIRSKSLVVAGMAVLASTVVSSGETSRTADQLSSEVKPRVIGGYGKLPLHFEPNQGQADGQVRFLARGSGYGLFLTPNESVLVLRKTEATVLRMKLLGTNPRPVVAGREELPGKSNYFIGNDPKKWRTNVPQYARIEYEDVYPGVSLAYYGNQGQIEYDFVVKPGADPKRIRLAIEGADAVRVDGDGNLVLSLGDGEIVERAPVVYQEVDGAQKAIDGRFILRGAREIAFEVGAYDHDRPLVIDPVLAYATYLGGSGGDVGQGIVVDASGNAYVTGTTDSTNFPTASPLQAANGGGADAFVAKLNTAGSVLIYSTYLGGSGDDAGFGIAVDASGNAYVTGLTTSTDFPTANPLQAASGGGPQDAFLAKLNTAGTALVYSTYLGGSGRDVGVGIAVDASGTGYVTGITDSTDFPTANPIQAAFGGAFDAFVAKVNAAGSALIYSTYFGGSGGDRGQGIVVDASGNAYVTGTTDSTNFPTASPLQAANGGGVDAFVAKLNTAGSVLIYSTYLGGSGFDGGLGIVIDASGDAYVTGYTDSTNFPTASPLQAANGGGVDAFVAKLSMAGSALVYSTYIGGSDDDLGQGIAVDTSANTHVTGLTQSTNFPTANALQGANGGATDAFVAKLHSAGLALVYSAYLGGSGYDEGRGIAVDTSGNAYVAGFTSSDNFPTANPLQLVNGGINDAFVAKIGSGSPPPGDFNADGRPDILWRNQSTGDNVVWFMNGTTLTGGAVLTSVSDTHWQVVGTTTFNGDVRTDILWRNRGTGNNVVWFMNGTTIAGGVVLASVADPNWWIVATADFNADGKADILWRNQATGDNIVWFMDGTTIAGGAVLTAVADTNWKIVGAADFNADGKPDILWRNQASGDNLVWFMDGTAIAGGAVLMPVGDVSWVVGGVGDYNADDKTDILWRNQTTGDNLVWFMDGTTVAGGAVLIPVSDTNWKIVGPR